MGDNEDEDFGQEGTGEEEGLFEVQTQISMATLPGEELIGTFLEGRGARMPKHSGTWYT